MPSPIFGFHKTNGLYMGSLIFVRYLHFIGIFCLFASVFAEHMMITPTMTRKQIKKVAVIDSIYGISALVVLIAGLLLWFWVGKPAEYYSKNPIFHTKLTLFVIMGLLSIKPTMYFLKHRKGNDLDTEIEVPKSILMYIRMEMLLLVIIPLLAVMMSIGIGN